MKHILVVDDDPAMLEVIRRSLVAAGYRVTAVSEPAIALDCIARDAVDLAVTDFRMPNTNGRELIAAAQKLRPGLKTLVVSGSPPEDGDDHSWWRQQATLT